MLLRHASTDFIVAWGTQRFNENNINLSYLFRLHFKRNSTPKILGTYLWHCFKYNYIHWGVLICDTPATCMHPKGPFPPYKDIQGPNMSWTHCFPREPANGLSPIHSEHRGKGRLVVCKNMIPKYSACWLGYFGLFQWLSMSPFHQQSQATDA